MVEDQDTVGRQSGIFHKILLTGPKISEDLKRIVVWHMPHRHRFKLPDKNRGYRDAETGDCLSSNCLACDTVGINVRDKCYCVRTSDDVSCGTDVLNETHSYLLGVAANYRYGLPQLCRARGHARKILSLHQTRRR